MNGAELLLKTAVVAGIEVCFANAGTTELPIVAAFDSTPGIHPVMGLFEGVCTGAADGYGRVKGKPAMTLLHLGPGLANGIANLHNARRAGIPLINIIGEHTTWHRAADPPLAMDIEKLAGPVSGWIRTCRSAQDLSGDMAAAVSAAMEGQIASLVIPNDLLLEDAGETVSPIRPVEYSPLDTGSIDAAAKALQSGVKAALMLGGPGLRGAGLQAAGQVSAVTGCDLFTVTFPGYTERGAGLPIVHKIPYFPEPALDLLSPYEIIVLAGIEEPVTFFGYANIDSYLLNKTQQKLYIGEGRQDVASALEALASMVRPSTRSRTIMEVLAKAGRPELPRGALTAEKACQALAALQPEEAIIVDEGITSGIPYYPLTAGVPPHSILAITGGAIGYGMPCAVGAALASPDRPVINFQADGSAMYTLQALWTEARESLNVTTLICSNRGYNILRVEFERAGIKKPGPKALSLADIDNPSLDWVKLASGMGVPATSVSTVEGLARDIERALEEPGPHLIEMKF